MFAYRVEGFLPAFGHAPCSSIYRLPNHHPLFKYPHPKCADFSWWLCVEITFLQGFWGGGGYQLLAEPPHPFMWGDRLLQAVNEMNSVSQGNSEAFCTEMSCWPWALHVSWVWSTLPAAHKAIHRQLGSRRAARITCRQVWVGTHPNTPSLARGRCKFRAVFCVTSDLLQVLSHHCNNAHGLTTLRFEKLESKQVALRAWHA